jgi:hypothetical protein
MSPLTPEDLLQRDIDGENDAEEAAALALLLSERPALRAQHETLKKVAAELRRVGMAEAPPALVADVRREIRVNASRPSPGWGQLRAAFLRKPALGYAMSLAAGLVIGGVGVALSGPSALFSRADTSSAAGALLPRERLEPSGALDQQRLSLAGLQGYAVTRASEGHLLTDVSIESGGPVDLTLEFDPSLFAPVAFRLDDGARGAASLVAGRFHVAAASPGTYRLVLAPAGPQRTFLRLRLQTKGGALLEKDLQTVDDR